MMKSVSASAVEALLEQKTKHVDPAIRVDKGIALVVLTSRVLRFCGFEDVSMPGSRKLPCTAVRYSCAV
jgi:hypothetical protein